MTWEEFVSYMDQHPNIEVTLDGGGDSGGVNVKGCEDSKITDILENIVYGFYDYGSFAGEFSVYLTGEWDYDQKALVMNGDEESRENHVDEEIKTLTIEIEPHLASLIDSINVYVSMAYGDNIDKNVRVNIKNGIWLDEFDTLEEKISSELGKVLDTVNQENAHMDEVLIIQDNVLTINLECYNYAVTDKSADIGEEDILEYLNGKQHYEY
jgi:hypothetical protein